MATNFPESLDDFTNPTGSDNLSTSVGGRTHSQMHADKADAIEAIQRALLPVHTVRLYEDFVGGNMGALNFIGSGSGAAGQANGGSAAGHDGLCALQTGTTTSGRAHLGITSGGTTTSKCILGEGSVVVEWLMRIPNVSDATDTFTVRVGMGDGTSEPTDGVYFRYTHGTNSGKWECVTRSNSVETASDSGLTIVANDWYRLRIEVNAAGTSVAFKVATNGGSLSTVATNTTNIPTGATRDCGPLISINKSAGTTSRFIDVDYFLFLKTYTTAR